MSEPKQVTCTHARHAAAILAIFNDAIVNSTALYATGRIYAGFAETTMQSQTLTAITSIQDPSEAERYNAMLDQISQLRQQYK